ncbi:MAG: MotA/TolQ/ExbB proton channel family protein [Thermoflexaceae bacterium]|nr:MotA/TolQ/ExbB proton channel family protein [Thermoflexaceae bacterium]
MKQLNSTAFAGFVLCFLIILSGIATNGGLQTILNYVHIPSMLVTFGGSLFAVMITADSFTDYLDGMKSFLTAFRKNSESASEITEQILNLSQTARKEGLLALEERQESVAHPLLKKGIRLIVDGTEQDLLKNILEIDMMKQSERKNKQIAFWRDLGAYAPAWGMVGTLLGLINMMLSIGADTAAIGQGMSLALITTLYGSVVSNWICIPVSNKLEKRRNQEMDIMELIIEGILSIQAGENPQLIKEKIEAFL